MAKTFLRTVLVQNRDELADRTFQQDLPVNPLAGILVTLRFQNAAANPASDVLDLYAMMTNVGVEFRGQDVIRGSLLDLAVLNSCVARWQPYGYVQGSGDNNFLSLTVPICFGRRPYLGVEAFPATRRGDLVFEATVDAATTEFDVLSLQIETIELLDAQPAAFLKYTTIANTFATTGQETIRLPIGNPLLGCLLFGTTVPTLAARTATWEQLRVKIDNVEAGYARANWETLHGEMLRRVGSPSLFLEGHEHDVNAAAAGQVDSNQVVRQAGALGSYAYLDYDPEGDLEYMVDTAGRADVVIQRDVGTADAGRALPVEMVRVQPQSAAA